jgi:hypothetical protein
MPTAESTSKTQGFFRSFAAGGLAGVVTKTSVQPLDRVKNILQVRLRCRHLRMPSRSDQLLPSEQIQGQGGSIRNPKYNGIVSTIRTVLKEEGVLALWKGNAANCTRIVPVYAVRFASNDTIQKHIAGPGRTKDDLTMMELIAGGTVAGLIQQVSTYPLETIKARMSLAHQTGQHYTSMWNCVTTTAKHEGWAALFKGGTASILYGAPYVGAQMSLYEMFQRWFPKDPDTGKPGIASKLAAGGCTGVTAQTLVFPMNTVRTRLQINGIGGAAKVYDGLWHCISTMYRTEGVRGFFKGCGANNVRMLPNGVIQFAAFDFFKKVFEV